MRDASGVARDDDGNATVACLRHGRRGYGETPYSIFARHRACTNATSWTRGAATATLPPGFRTVATRGHVCVTAAARDAEKLVAILEAIITTNDK